MCWKTEHSARKVYLKTRCSRNDEFVFFSITTVSLAVCFLSHWKPYFKLGSDTDSMFLALKGNSLLQKNIKQSTEHTSISFRFFSLSFTCLLYLSLESSIILYDVLIPLGPSYHHHWSSVQLNIQNHRCTVRGLYIGSVKAIAKNECKR